MVFFRAYMLVVIIWSQTSDSNGFETRVALVGKGTWGEEEEAEWWMRSREWEMIGYKRRWWGWSARGGDVERTVWKTSSFLLLGCSSTSSSVLVSAAWASWVQRGTACARESLRRFMKYLSSPWGDMRKVTRKVKRTKQGERPWHCQNDKYSC